MKVGVLQGDHTAPVQCVQFNPKYMMLSTACNSMVGPCINRHVLSLTVTCKKGIAIAIHGILFSVW